jgi:HK97 family phage portal protein
VGLFDFLGPLNAGRAPRGWGNLPPAPSTERRALDLSAPRPLVIDGAASFWTPSTTTLSAADAGDNSAVVACLTVLASSVIEPPLAVYRPGPAGGADRVPAPLPALTALLARPNPAFPLATMLAFATISTRTDGNGYWRKVRSGDPVRGNVVELWPVSPDRIEPYTRPGSGDLITAYRHTDEHGHATDLDPANVVHFRYGLDPADHRLGYAPLRALYSEVSADQQATRYAARLLANLAINGLTLSFDKEAAPIDQATADELKSRIAAAYGGNNVGATAVLSPGATLTAMGFSPEQMDMKTLHRVPEERISAVLGVPAIVAGLGAGLDRSTFANFEEAREAFTELTLVPLWASIAATLTMSLAPDFTSEKAVYLDFDTSRVRALQEDQDALATRLVSLVAAGILTTDEARAVLNRGPKPAEAAQPAARSRPVLVRRPSDAERPSEARRGSAVRARKDAAELMGDLDALRRSSYPDWEREVRTFLAAQLGRVSARLADGTTSAFGLVPQGEATLLGSTLSPLQLALLDDLVPLVAAELGIAFNLDDPATRGYLRSCGVNIQGITDTTRAQVQAALAEGQAAGEGIPQLAARLSALPTFGQARATLVARTELGLSSWEASLAAYGGSGVVLGIRILDGDYDAACAARDGTVLTLAEAAAAPRLLHPNCTAAPVPLTSADDLTRSA